jgi:hypothetical protein
MKQAKISENQIVADVLSKAFEENQSVNYVVRQDRKRVLRIRRLMEYSYNICKAFGKIWISEDGCGCELVLLPDKKRNSIHTISWDIKLALTAIGIDRIGAALEREKRIKAFHPKGSYCYLWFIGVRPSHQFKGIGSDLLTKIAGACEIENGSIYLETSVESNLAWYQKFGFEIFHKLDLGYTLYLLRRGAGVHHPGDSSHGG